MVDSLFGAVAVGDRSYKCCSTAVGAVPDRDPNTAGIGTAWIAHSPKTATQITFTRNCY